MGDVSFPVASEANDISFPVIYWLQEASKEQLSVKKKAKARIEPEKSKDRCR
jgi:hypothetical protein